jgi:hypothetical protein
MLGGKRVAVLGPTQMWKVPVVCPPRVSVTVTASGQSAQVPEAGRLLGVN